MRRLALLSVLLGFAGAFAVCFLMRVTPAAADAPVQQGWWTALNPGVGGVSPPVAVPPDVPANGLFVEGGPSASSPAAYSALLYSLGPGASAGTLTLQVTSNSATTPNSKLEICPLTSAFNSEEGAPSSDAPSYDCTKNLTASASSSGATYQFDASSLVSNGTLAIAILPTSPTDRVVLNAPDANSLAVQAPANSSGASSSGNSSGAFSGASGSVSIPSSGASGPTGSFSVPGGSSSQVAPSASAPATQSSSPAPRNENFEAFPAFGTVSQRAAPLAVALVAIGLIGAAALWIYAGRRRPDEQAL